MLAATVTLAGVLIMLTPLRRGPVDHPSREAGWSPLLNLGGMADTAAFRRLQASDTRFAVSAHAVSRRPSAKPAP